MRLGRVRGERGDPHHGDQRQPCEDGQHPQQGTRIDADRRSRPGRSSPPGSASVTASSDDPQAENTIISAIATRVVIMIHPFRRNRPGPRLLDASSATTVPDNGRQFDAPCRGSVGGVVDRNQRNGPQLHTSPSSEITITPSSFAPLSHPATTNRDPDGNSPGVVLDRAPHRPAETGPFGILVRLIEPGVIARRSF